jgi:methyl-accepting chemotaxis protein
MAKMYGFCLIVCTLVLIPLLASLPAHDAAPKASLGIMALAVFASIIAISHFVSFMSESARIDTLEYKQKDYDEKFIHFAERANHDMQDLSERITELRNYIDKVQLGNVSNDEFKDFKNEIHKRLESAKCFSDKLLDMIKLVQDTSETVKPVEDEYSSFDEYLKSIKSVLAKMWSRTG